jgi:hypothetical protein
MLEVSAAVALDEFIVLAALSTICGAAWKVAKSPRPVPSWLW